MTANFLKMMSSDVGRAMQRASGSRAAYSAMESRSDGQPDLVTEKEAAFLAARDSFYMASITPDGWPYVQHRGGSPGFLRQIGPSRIGFADYRGNRQFMSAGNLAVTNRVALILVDYVAKRRLKLVGHAQWISVESHPDEVLALITENLIGGAEGAVLIDVLAFDWNCPQHITQRWTASEIANMQKRA